MKTTRPTHRQRVRQSNRRQREAAIDAAEAGKTKLPASALDRAVMNTPLAGYKLDDPNRNPLWIEAGQAEDRRRVMREVDAYENSSYSCILGPATNYITVRGESYRIHDFIEQQSFRTYQMLRRGIEVGQIAKEVYRDPEYVLAVAEKYNIQVN